MTRNAAIGLLLREIAEEMPIVLRALPDDRLWSAMVAGLMADHNVDELAEKLPTYRYRSRNRRTGANSTAPCAIWLTRQV